MPASGWQFCTTEPGRPDSTSFLNVLATRDSSGSTSWHSQWVSELAAATSGQRACPGTSLYIANYATNSAREKSWDWCFNTQGSHSMNWSAHTGDGTISTLRPDDMSIDYFVKHSPFPLVVAAAGNDGTTAGTGTNEYVTHGFFNGLVIGGSNDHGTNDLSDDTMYNSTSWKNYTTNHGDYELPNLVAPAVSLTSASSINASGTSGASPITLGAINLASNRDGTQYVNWPEMQRATALAASTRSVTGTRTVSLPPAAGDIRQGVGLLDANRMMWIANPAFLATPNAAPKLGGHAGKTYNFTSDFSNVPFGAVSYDAWYIGPIPALSFSRVRVAIAYTSTATGCSTTNATGCSGDTLDGDLDLEVIDQNGARVCYSSSYDASYEVCDFLASVNSTYRARLVRYSAVQATTFLGISWQVYSAL